MPSSIFSNTKPFLLGFVTAVCLGAIVWGYSELGVSGGSGSTSPNGNFILTVSEMLDGKGVVNFALRNARTKEITRKGSVQILNSPFSALARGAKFVWDKNEEYVDIVGTNNGFVLRLSTLDNETEFSQPTSPAQEAGN